MWGIEYADRVALSTLTEEVAMLCYAGIDLHATNSVLVVMDEADRVLYQKRLRNDLAVIRTALDPYQATAARRRGRIHLSLVLAR